MTNAADPQNFDQSHIYIIGAILLLFYYIQKKFHVVSIHQNLSKHDPAWIIAPTRPVIHNPCVEYH